MTVAVGDGLDETVAVGEGLPLPLPVEVAVGDGLDELVESEKDREQELVELDSGVDAAGLLDGAFGVIAWFLV